MAAVKRRYHLPDRFILYVRTLEPRKNLARLIGAHRRLREEGVRHGLVIAGGRGWLCDDVFEAAGRDGLGEHVIFTGHLNEDELLALHQSADVFAYPSLYEGFGLPVLEAMACGVPVVCLDRAPPARGGWRCRPPGGSHRRASDSGCPGQGPARR